MIKCIDCGSTQYEGTLFCSECGRTLHDLPVQPNEVSPFNKPVQHLPPPPLKDYAITPFSSPILLHVVIAGERQRMTLNLVDEIRVGRADDEDKNPPELDLTDFDGIEKGVSREHAFVRATDKGIVLVDHHSTNGTLLNNKLLSPERPYLLKSGDEIRFGDLLVHMFYET